MSRAKRHEHHSGRVRRCAVAVFAILVASGCGESSAPPPPPPPANIEGTVTGGEPLAGATVSFIEAFSAGAEVTSVQPLEDLAASAAVEATTDADGRYQVDLEAGRYFVYVTPPAGDDVHLPGGSGSRASRSFGEGASVVVDVELSEQPPTSATYVGSSTCLGCHPAFSSHTQTLHALGFRRLTAAGSELSSLQDLSKFPDANGALAFFPDGNPDDNTGAGDGFGFRASSGVGYSILLGVDATGHFQALESADGTRVSERLYIPFTYGGEGRFKQLFATRLDENGAYTADASAGTYHLLPAQYSETEGRVDQSLEQTMPGWVTYEPARWDAPAADGGSPAKTPAAVDSFDNQCAGCHFTGMSLTRNAAGLFRASAVADPGGPIDFDGDGELEEMNIGCERCHGPGSAHVANPPRFVVQPARLPPGRANMICAQCHVNGQGNGTIAGEGRGGYPSRNDSQGAIEFVRAGISPAEFFGSASGQGILPSFGTSGGFFNPVNLSTNATAAWLDAAGGFGSRLDHSKSNTQHYLDHARSTHAQNPFDMLACQDCHDPHGVDFRGQVSRESDNNVLCLGCHAGFGDFQEVTQEMVDEVESGGDSAQEMFVALNDHVKFRTFDLIFVAMNLGPSVYGMPGNDNALGRCTYCHMPRTARSGSWIVDDEGFVIRGDISSHTLDNIAPDVSEAMGIGGSDPLPNSCVDCHRGIPRRSWPDYRFRKEP